MELENILAQAKIRIQEARRLDDSNNAEAAFVQYEAGVELLSKYKNRLPADEYTTRQIFDDKIKSYTARAQTLRARAIIPVENMIQLPIPEGSTDFGYETVFMRCLDAYLTEVKIQDPYISTDQQVMNLVLFCEMVVRNSPNLKRIRLNTNDKRCASNSSKFSELEASLLERNVKFDVKYIENLHDREIRFNNGWVITPDRGLDWFQKQSSFRLGVADTKFRTCKKTTIRIIEEKGRPTPQ